MLELLPLFVVVPLGVAFLLPILDTLKISDWLADALAVVAAGAVLVGSIALLPLDGVYWVGGWTPARVLGISLVADGLAKLLLVTVSVIALAAIVFSLQYMGRYTSKGLYYSLFFLMVAGMNGVILAGDLFNLYVFIEIAAIASYALVGFGCESDELEASFKYLVLGSVASTFILFGVGITYNLTGTLNMAQVAQAAPGLAANPAMVLVAAFFFLGFGLKAAMVPFHAWLPDAHPSAPAPISAMLSGVFIKASGVYALTRIFFNVLGMSALYAHVLIALGALSMVIGVLLAVGQWDFKRLLAYHSISQMGYVVLALGVGGEVLARGGPQAVAALAIFGGLFHLINHAAFKSLLFLCSGSIEHETGTRQLKELGGLMKRMPLTGTCCRIAALSISGVPPFNGFWSKLVIVIAVVQAGHWALGAMTVLVSFVTLLSFIKVQRYALQGQPSARVLGIGESPALMGAALVALAGICLVGGLVVPAYRGAVLDPARDVILAGLEYGRIALGG
ncbi:MAG: proton-conducting transporter membrane subunit [Gemmatimonadota bacterium]